jgi:AAA-like domain
MRKHRRDAEPTTPLRLALREIHDNLTFTRDHATVWYVLGSQRWSFRSDAQRSELIAASARRLAGLVGHRVHIRVTSRPYPARVWAQNLDHITPHPLPGVDGNTWGDHLVRAQKRLQHATLSDKEVYLGVRVGLRGKGAKVAETLRRGVSSKELHRLTTQVTRIGEVVAGSGFNGRPATADEMEWLLHRSLAVGLPSPTTLSPTTGGVWERDDLYAFSDTVRHITRPYGSTVRVLARRGGRDVERHVAVLTMGRMDSFTIPESSHDPWMQHTDRLPFPVEWSSTFDVVSGERARGEINRKLLIIRDMQRHHHEHDVDEPLDLQRKAERAKRVEDEMTEGDTVQAARTHGWHRIAVTGRDEDECLERVRRVQEVYEPMHMSVEHPHAQHALLREFVPGEPVGSTAHKRRLPVHYQAAGLPNVTASVGDRRGPYLGYTCGTSRHAVMFDPHYGPEVYEASGLVPLVGGLGAGKSVLLGNLAYESARRGIITTILDPSGPLARLADLPELAEHAEHVDLLRAAPGTLNPYSVIPEPRPGQYPDAEALAEARAEVEAERKMLATDVVRMLLPPQIDAQPETAVVIADAVRRNGGSWQSTLWDLISRLDALDDEHGFVVANYLRDMSELPQSRLFFGQPTRYRTDSEATLLVLTMAGLTLPDSSVDPRQWTTAERMAVPLLHLATYYATRRVYGRVMGERKMIGLDEAGQMGAWGSGRALFTRLGRDTRKWNTAALVSSQDPADVLGLNIANYISTAFVGRIEDPDIAAEALRLLRVPHDVGYESVLAGLSPHVSGHGTARRGSREFVVKDVQGNVEKVRIDLAHNPDLLAALDTTARPHDEAADREAVA